MKIRIGFVSNSSSSSYIISVQRSFEDIINEIDPPEMFYPHNIISYFKTRIDETKEFLATTNNILSLGIRNIMQEQCESQIKEYSRILKLAEKANKQPNKYNIELIKTVLKFLNISIRENKESTTFVGSSTIHNNFSDIGDILASICLWYLFKHPELITAEEISTQ